MDRNVWRLPALVPPLALLLLLMLLVVLLLVCLGGKLACPLTFNTTGGETGEGERDGDKPAMVIGAATAQGGTPSVVVLYVPTVPFIAGIDCMAKPKLILLFIKAGSLMPFTGPEAPPPMPVPMLAGIPPTPLMPLPMPTRTPVLRVLLRGAVITLKLLAPLPPPATRDTPEPGCSAGEKEASELDG